MDVLEFDETELFNDSTADVSPNSEPDADDVIGEQEHRAHKRSIQDAEVEDNDLDGPDLGEGVDNSDVDSDTAEMKAVGEIGSCGETLSEFSPTPPKPINSMRYHNFRSQRPPRLGTSAPINIPLMTKWQGAVDSDSDSKTATTFIPPHQLSAANDFLFTFTGGSPSASIKRERLKARNAILRSTGFLEPTNPRHTIHLASQPIVRTPTQSMLTQSLTTIGELHGS